MLRHRRDSREIVPWARWYDLVALALTPGSLALGGFWGTLGWILVPAFFTAQFTSGPVPTLVVGETAIVAVIAGYWWCYRRAVAGVRAEEPKQRM